ncbi:transcription factor hamlet-like [Mytilus edulis]|uniref:transcription factor hamlet-like n=1 Tax=Mytilus edulis TaxID=6550 RepID=UPI0039F10574
MDAKFSCEFCDLSFTKKRNKKRHEKEIHGQRKKNSHCDICNSSFGRKSDLKRHVRKFHSDENKGHQEVPAEKEELLVKIPDYSDISDDDIEWDDNNNITSDYNFPDRNANGDATTSCTYEADNCVTVEKENCNLDGFCVVDDDFLDITEEEFTDMKSNLVVEEEVKTVTLTLIKTEQKFLDGSVKVKKETCIGYTENVDKNRLNVPDIVTEVTNLINDVVDSNNNVPEMFYNL